MEVLYDGVREDNLDDPKALRQKVLTRLNAGFVHAQLVF
jgi:hypothetical protein